MAAPPPRRVLVAKPGLDGHDRGAKIVARALRDAGYEVIYTGIRQKVPAVAELALVEDVDLVGLSVLSGAHLGLARQVLAALRDKGLDDVKVVIGGTIPASDRRALLDLGVDAVFPTGTSVEEVLAGVNGLWPERPASPRPRPGVRVERSGAVALIVIDRPRAQNAISRPTMVELDAALDEVAADPEVRVAAVRGQGERVFVSGGDLKELASIRTEAEAAAMALTMRTLLDRVASLPVPVVAALNGHAYGGGCEVAMACDFRLAADDVKMAFNQVDLGIMPAWGGIERLQAVVGRGKALYLVTTGLPIDAPTAAAWGLVELVVPRADFDDRLRELLDRIARAPRDALVGIKATADAARPAARPDLAPAATAAFARTWVADAHWSAVAAMAERRRRARSAP